MDIADWRKLIDEIEQPEFRETVRDYLLNTQFRRDIFIRGANRLSHYVASKWGLTGLTKSFAIELAQYNIRAISIHPTGVNTPMQDGLATIEGSTPLEIAERSAGNLLPVPWVEPEDVANAVVFLTTDNARYLTGTEFVVDAGLLTR